MTDQKTWTEAPKLEIIMQNYVDVRDLNSQVNYSTDDGNDPGPVEVISLYTIRPVEYMITAQETPDGDYIYSRKFVGKNMVAGDSIKHYRN